MRRGKKKERLRVFSTKVFHCREKVFSLTMSTHDEFTHANGGCGPPGGGIEQKRGREEETLRNPTSGAESACVRARNLVVLCINVDN